MPAPDRRRSARPVSGPDDRRLVLVVGVGRSGTSLLTGILGQLGFHIPQPEVKANDTNPRGFGEPRWVVDFHSRLLVEHGAMVNDARPARGRGRAPVGATPRRSRSCGSGSRASSPTRTRWWSRTPAPRGSSRSGAAAPPTSAWRASYVSMLRHPPEILASARKSYGERLTMPGRAAAWLNVTLETERATRGGTRAYVRYEDLLVDWRKELTRVGAALELPLLSPMDPDRATAVDGFVDPALHRNRVGWDEFDLPPYLEEMAEAVWNALQPLADPGGDDATLHATLDDWRSAYAKLYDGAEAIAESSVRAVRRPRRRASPKPRRTPDVPPSLRVRLTRRVPARYRRRLRRAVGRLGRDRRR
jgi:hypothetical protein